MEITCERCARGHEIADDRIPPFGARLRCSGCGQLFELPAQDNGVRVRVRVGGRRGRNAGDEALPDLVVVTREGPPGTSLGHGPVSPLGGDSVADAVDEGAEPEAIEPEVPEPTTPEVSEPSAPPEPLDPCRLARMLLTDIIYGDPERFESARREGRILGAFAVEIERAFAFYRERVGDEIALQTPHFRAALLEVLGRNEPVDD